MPQTLSFKNLRVLVLGLGLHGGGLAVANWLISQGARVTVSDLKTAQELKPSLKKLIKSPNLKLVLGRQPVSLLKDCDLVVQNPGVPRQAPIIKLARRLKMPIENEASLFLKICPS
ncbi:MAG: UDP-N-acetylmuramoyl-L-alanine--D-glutamate ligase, partial [Patescibacteria group bacterium]